MKTDAADDIETIARLIWIRFNDQRKTGTFGLQLPETQRLYLQAATEIYEFIAPIIRRHVDSGDTP